jgi:hypothetical protein
MNKKQNTNKTKKEKQLAEKYIKNLYIKFLKEKSK